MIDLLSNLSPYQMFNMAIPVLGFAAAWGGAVQGLNGTKQRVKKLEDNSDKNRDDFVETRERLVRVETKLDTLIERIK